MGSGIAVTAGRTGRSLAISIYDSTNREYARPICLAGRIPDQSAPNRTQNKKIEHKATIITKERDKNEQKQDSDGNIECCGDHSGNYHSIHRKHIDYLRVWDHPKFSDHSSTAQLPSTPTLYALTASNIASVYLGGMACYKICSPTKGGFLPGMLGYGLICFALFVLSAYGIFMQYGFCDAVICHIFGAILSAAMISGAKSEECRSDL